MRYRVIQCVRLWGPIALSLLAAAAVAQQPADTTYIISATDKPFGTIPPVRSGKPSFDVINPEREGVRPTLLYSTDDRVFAGVNYNRFSSNWVPDSLGAKHKAYVHYSFNQQAPSIGYQAIFHRIAPRWNLYVETSFDWEKWINFSGLGNESVPQVGDQDFFRTRTREAIVSAAFQRRIGKQSSFTLTPFYQYVQVRRDFDRFLQKAASNDARLSNPGPNNFAGLRADLQLQRLNDLLLPTSGYIFSTGVAQTVNLTSNSAVTNYSAYSRLYFSFLRHFVLSVENGAAMLTGSPEFYQYNALGGSTLRGFRRGRFWGETMYHNNNELHYLFDAPQRLFKGKMGIMTFVDQGRVWNRGEVSNTWHRSYGGGLILVPYRKIYLSLQYGISPERKGFGVEFRRAL